MPRIDDAFETIDLLYRASIEPELWPEALEKFAFSVGCIGMAMIPITPNDVTGLVVSPDMRDVDVEYRREWWRHDSRVRRIFARQLSRGVCCEAQLFNVDEIAKDPFRQEFCRKWGIGSFAAQLVEPWPGHVVAFSAQRGLKHGHIDDGDLDTLRLLGQHAARSLTISLRLAAGDSVIAGLFDLLEKFEGGVFVINGRREIALMNAAAERLVGDGLTVAKRRLLASASDRQKALDGLVASAFDRRRKSAEFGPLALPRPSGRKPLLVQAMPLSSRRTMDDLERFAFAPEAALLLVIDPEQAGSEPHEGLRLLGLTAAEARLAALIGTGMRRRDAAADLGISEWTARDTLKQIYSKLDIRSQGELVRLVSRIAAVEQRPQASG